MDDGQRGRNDAGSHVLPTSRDANNSRYMSEYRAEQQRQALQKQLEEQQQRHERGTRVGNGGGGSQASAGSFLVVVALTLAFIGYKYGGDSHSAATNSKSAPFSAPESAGSASSELTQSAAASYSRNGAASTGEYYNRFHAFLLTLKLRQDEVDSLAAKMDKVLSAGPSSVARYALVASADNSTQAFAMAAPAAASDSSPAIFCHSQAGQITLKQSDLGDVRYRGRDGIEINLTSKLADDDLWTCTDVLQVLQRDYADLPQVRNAVNLTTALLK